MNSLRLGLMAVKDGTEFASLFAPIPALLPLVEVLSGIVQMCENVTKNKHAARTLRDRCCLMVLNLQEHLNTSTRPDGPIKDTLEAIQECLRFIQARMMAISKLSKIKAFTEQEEVKTEIEECHKAIDDSLIRFQIVSQVGLVDWTREFEAAARHDHEEVVAYLSDIRSGQELISQSQSEQSKLLEMQKVLLEQQNDDMRNLLQTFQQMMSANKHSAQVVHIGLSTNLHKLQKYTGELLPNMRLNSGEVLKIGNFPVSGTAATDIYEGLYLQKEKVAIKVVRTVNSSAHSARRFEREVSIWTQVWKRDKGEHVLPFYGVCDNDGPFPYLVSPWMQNGTAMQYVKTHEIDYPKMMEGIAIGIQILHTMDPPVVHGDIKAENIVINNQGNPLISDFGLSKIVEDITGVPFTQSRGVSDSYRWFAPELCVGNGTLSLSSDIYAYGMTVLELMTQAQPFREIRQTTEVVIRASQGKHPDRPQEAIVLARGLNDRRWALLLECWNSDSTSRPPIQKVLRDLLASH